MVRPPCSLHRVHCIAEAECGLAAALVVTQSDGVQTQPLARPDAYHGKFGPFWAEAVEAARSVTADRKVVRVIKYLFSTNVS